VEKRLGGSKNYLFGPKHEQDKLLPKLNVFLIQVPILLTRMKDVIDLYRDVVIEIATPYFVGTGFYLREHALIVTNEHVVRDNKAVVINGPKLEKQLAPVVFIDVRHDLAFLAAPQIDVPIVALANDKPVHEGDPVIAIGHPFGLKFSATQGIVSNAKHDREGVTYIQHDAALNPGNSGGPLVNANGAILGVNTFIMKDGNSIGFCLPVDHLQECIDAYQKGNGELGALCTSCSNAVFQSSIEGQYCPHCGAKVALPNKADDFEPVGIPNTIEEIIEKAGYHAELSRSGPNNWSIQKGSARINITYYEETGLITGDAYLCNLPKDNIKPLYEFLLRQNYLLEGLTLSMKDSAIILSLLIFDRYLNVEIGLQMFQYLFEQADYYDNVLVEEYGAVWREE
jgi:serine protease Do